MGKKGLGGIKKLKAFTSCHGGVVGGGAKLRLPGSIPGLVTCFFSVGFRVKRKGLSRVKKLKTFSLCHGGVVVETD